MSEEEARNVLFDLLVKGLILPSECEEAKWTEEQAEHLKEFEDNVQELFDGP